MPSKFDRTANRLIDVAELCLTGLTARVFTVFVIYNYQLRRDELHPILTAHLYELPADETSAQSVEVAVDSLLGAGLLEICGPLSLIAVNDAWDEALQREIKKKGNDGALADIQLVVAEVRARAPGHVEEDLIERLGARTGMASREALRRALRRATRRIRIATYSSVGLYDSVVGVLTQKWRDTNVSVELLTYSPRLAAKVEGNEALANDVILMKQKWRQAFEAARGMSGASLDRGFEIRWIDDERFSNFGRIILIDDDAWLLTVNKLGVGRVIAGPEYAGSLLSGDGAPSNVFAVLDHFWTSTWQKALRVPERYRAFVIHGTNHALRSEVVAILRDVGVDPVVLEDVPDDPQETIIEKFTRVFRQESCDLAIAILSPDDLTASAAAKGRGAKGRARQNAVFEVGYAYAMLGRANTLLLVPNDEEGLAPEMWSDISGVLYYRMDGAGNWRNALRAFIERRKERGMWPFAR